MDPAVTVGAAINAGDPKNYEEPGKHGSPCKIFPPSFMGKLGHPNDVYEVAPFSRTPLAGTSRNGLSQNIP
jgi:hypothetical protein